ncbi:MAG TPA: response regulator [Oligoflexia bacterium]|nr:response regulator [Oligoflexia bacterium]HMP47939.1 response regulator [Oligoflexia bacterium]
MSRDSILIVEDDQTVLESLRDILVTAGYEVHCACNAIQALDCLTNAKSPSWVLIDYAIEGLDARKYVEKVKLSYPGAKIILSSGYSQDKINRDEGGRIDGIDKFIEKPFNPKLLIEAMK